MKRLERWAGQNGLEIVQIATPGSAERQLAQAGVLEPGDLVVALGGDGTVLSALHASAPVGSPVLGVACGSVGALAAVTGDALAEALDRVLAGDWTARRLPALSIEMPNGDRDWAVNDFVGVRRGAGQLVASLTVDDELYARMAGDGVIVATALGSSAYSMAAGGPLLAAGTPAFVCTPLAMHGGNAPPLVVPATSTLHVQLLPGFAGFDIEIDGHNHPARDLDYAITLNDAKVTLISLHDRTSLGLTGLREKRLITDSARVLARDARGS
ncbi:MAG TPA: NAD(+)/NADH kinase [Thermoleophilaceae bacterium]